MAGSQRNDGSASRPEISVHWIDAKNAHLLDNVALGVFDHAIDPARLAKYLAGPANLMAIAMHGGTAAGQVVGMCMCVIHDHPDKPTELYLDEIGTGDDWRRRGIARALMLEVFKRADALGIDEIWLGTEPDNTPARGLYESFGVKGDEAVIYYLDW